MSYNFQISLGAAASGGGGAWPVNNVPLTIGQDLAELIVQNADVFQRTGAKVINLDAGTISMAYSGQVGRVINGTTVTAAMVQANKEFLKDFGQYCRDFGITINVEALLTSPPAKDWTYQVIGPAVEANLPITSFENDAEPSATVPDTPENYATLAANEVRIVQQIVKYFPDAKIGQWEAGTDVTASTDWWLPTITRPRRPGYRRYHTW